MLQIFFHNFLNVKLKFSAADEHSDGPKSPVEHNGMMNGWSSLATNKDSPIEFYFASDARFVLNQWHIIIFILQVALVEEIL